jgi:hypothetical protein
MSKPQESPKPEKKQTQYKPGQSGNPAGKPKGTRNFRQLYEECGALLAKQMILPGSNGKKVMVGAKEQMVLLRWALALRGDQNAMNRIEDRLDGSITNVTREIGKVAGESHGLNIIMSDMSAEEIAAMPTVEIHPPKKKPEGK